LNGWRVTQHGKPVDVPSGQPRSLLTYLLLQPGHAALRSTLVEELFPESPAERGRRYLSDALYRLRRSLDPAPILSDAERVWLDMEHNWWVDVWEFDRAATSEDAQERATSLELYSPLLAPEIEEHWILVQRVRLQERFVQNALESAAEAEAAHLHQRAEILYRRALEGDPLLEPAHRGLMRSLARNGQLAAALEHYDHLVNTLEHEVAAPPSSETRQLADQLFQELDLARRRAETRTARRLVGRVEERSRLLTALDQARAGQAGLVVILGEAGIGKSTLMRDLAHAADWRGWQIHWGAGQDGASPAPYAPLTDALREAMPEPRAAQLANMLPPIHLDLLARIFSELQRPSALPAEAFEPRRLPQALAQLLHALQEIAPLLLLLDNAQWGDPALWNLLSELLPLLHHQRVLFVLGAQSGMLQAHPAVWSQLETLDRNALAQIVALDGLSPNALAELAAGQQLASTENSTPLSQERLRALHTASGGNPLLALEILAAGTPHALLESRPAIATLVTQRLRRLQSGARQAATLAAILGSQFSYSQWETLWREENPYGSDLASYAAELERAEVLQINRNGYAFVHDTLHAAALADMEPATRVRRHAATLAMLEQSLPTTERDPLRMLYHARGG
jgi:DNA-binding SARP family transcriptional activator